ncbi:hypothetical protein C161_22309 [Paenibacillus sp. FSL R5-192]|uniref:C39 family peptidase n=1 Tax=Paenibacillus sp. FSL R5-192 TaxID=1226754 RepID=UPI0003E2B8FC|nr:C39 family peptidase [Paenibacillus sp. FSL R5-192]ETT32741.1 hypothetical protein C161_22309 [Paenibacillus sp. FSL R5-192]
MITVIPCGDEKMTCLEAEVSSVVRWMKRSHEMMFLDSWGIEYENMNGMRIGEKLSLGKRQKRFTYLEQFHGIKLTYIESASSDEIKELVSNGSPVTVYGNMYWIPWERPYYLQRNAPGHSFTVLGFVTQENSFVCMDCNFSNSYQKIGREDFDQCVQSYLKYSVVHEEMNNSDWTMDVACHFQHLKEKCILDRIDWFCEDINDNLDLKNEFEGFEVTNCPIFVRLTKVANGRFLFSRALKFISGNEQGRILVAYASMFNELANAWLILRGNLYRSYRDKTHTDIVKRTTIEKIKSISQFEKRLLERLLIETSHWK